MVANLRRLENDVGAQEAANGMVWYPLIHRHAERISAESDGRISAWTVAGIITVTSRQTCWGSNLAVAEYVARSLSEDKMVNLHDADIHDARATYRVDIKNNARLSDQDASLAAAYAIKFMAKEELLTLDPASENYQDGSPKLVSWSMGVKMLAVAVDLYRGESPQVVIPGYTLRCLFNNIVNPNDPHFVTVDAIVISACCGCRVEYGSRTLDELTKPLPADAGPFLDGCYPAFANAVMAACAALNEETGTHLTPSEYQAMVSIHWRNVTDITSPNYDPARFPVAP